MFIALVHEFQYGQEIFSGALPPMVLECLLA
jgi:hypothetical protein